VKKERRIIVNTLWIYGKNWVSFLLFFSSFFSQLKKKKDIWVWRMKRKPLDIVTNIFRPFVQLNELLHELIVCATQKGIQFNSISSIKSNCLLQNNENWCRNKFNFEDFFSGRREFKCWGSKQHSSSLWVYQIDFFSDELEKINIKISFGHLFRRNFMSLGCLLLFVTLENFLYF
jgi:hypothetical protein